jgi:hypothetical protein
MDIEVVHTAFGDVDRYVHLQGEALARRQRRVNLHYMSRSQRRCYYAQLRAEAAEATAQVDLPAPSMLSFTRRVVVREQPSEVADQPPVYIPEEPSVAPSASAGYRPADYRSESEDEMSPGSSGQDWSWHSDDVCLLAS